MIQVELLQASKREFLYPPQSLSLRKVHSSGMCGFQNVV